MLAILSAFWRYYFNRNVKIFELYHEKTSFFCIHKNKGAGVQHLGFQYIDSTIFGNLKPLATFCGCTAWFVSDLDGNPEDGFFGSHGSFNLRFQT